MDAQTFKFFEDLPRYLRGIEPRWIIFETINVALQEHLPLLSYHKTDEGWELKIGRFPVTIADVTEEMVKEMDFEDGEG